MNDKSNIKMKYAGDYQQTAESKIQREKIYLQRNMTSGAERRKMFTKNFYATLILKFLR